MIKVIKSVAAIALLSLLLLMIAVPVLGVNGWSQLLGVDIQTIVIKGVSRKYDFSLIDRLPVILLTVVFLATSCALVLFKTKGVCAAVRSFGRFIGRYTLDTFHLVKLSNVKYFLFLLLATTLYLAYCYPLTLDEPLTYYDFIKPPFWHALALYPYPNNHVFSTLLVNITNEIPALDLLFRLRLPAVLASLLTWILAYRFVRKYYGENVALFVVAVGTVVVTNMQHAYIARGYAFVMLFVVVGLYAAFNIVRDGNKRKDWVAFAVSSALGAWTMPSYLYPFLSISILIFIYNYRAWKWQVAYSALVGLLVFLMYAPILAVSGVEALTSNEFVQTIDRWTVIKSLPGFMLGTVVHIFYVPHYVAITIFALIIFYTLWKRDRQAIVLWIVFGITPCLFLTLHSVLPFFRTFFYYGFIFVFFTGVSFASLLSKIEYKKLTVGLLVVHLAGIAFFVKISRNLMPEVFQSDDVIKEVLADGKTYYIDSGISWLQNINLKFEAERRHYDISIIAGKQTDIRQLPVFDYYLIREKKNATHKQTPGKEMMGIFHTPIVIYDRKATTID